MQSTSPVAGRTGLSWVIVDSPVLVSLSLWSNQSVDAVQILLVLGFPRLCFWRTLFQQGNCFGSRHLMVMHRSTCCARDDCSCCWCLAAVGGSRIVIFHFLSSSLMKEIDDSYSWCCLDGSRRFLLSLLSTSDGSSWWKSSMDGCCFYTLVFLLVTPLHHDNLCTSS